MDYKNFSGETISEQDKAFAQEFANFVNGRMCSADQTGKELTRAHRYLHNRCSRSVSVSCASWHSTIKKSVMTSATSGLPGLQQRHTTD